MTTTNETTFQKQIQHLPDFNQVFNLLSFTTPKLSHWFQELETSTDIELESNGLRKVSTHLSS